MTPPLDRRSDVFSDWLEARVAGASTPDYEIAADPELGNLCAAANLFHDLSETWAQDVPVPTSPATSWEDLMVTRAGSLPSTSSIAHRRDWAGKHPGRWEAVNRFASGVLVVAMVIAIGVGAWRLAGQGGGTDPSPTEVAGLVPFGDDAAMATPAATPAEQQEPASSPTLPVTTPIEQLPGIQGAVLRDYVPVDQPPGIPDLFAIGVSVYQFDTAENARASYEFLVSNVTAEFDTQARNNTGHAVITNDVPGVGERASLVRLDFADDASYQAQEYVLTLDGTYVFAVMTVTGGPLTSEATPASITDASGAAVDLATALVTRGQPSLEETRFYADGTSTGGDWGFMPPADDQLLVGLLPQMDQQLYPLESRATEAGSSYPPDAQDLAGIVAAVYREYAPASMFVGSQSVSMEDATPMSEADLATNRFSSITVFAYQFEAPKDAAVAYDRLGKGLLGSLADLNQGDGQERLVSEDLSGIGDQATRSQLTVTSTSDGWTNQVTFQYLTVQRGEFVFVISAQGGVGPVETLPDPAGKPDPMLDLAVQVATVGEPSPDESTYATDGTSTGGLWGVMPAADDPLLMGLAPWMDQVLYPVPER